MALEFPDNERNKRYEIDALMLDWAKAVAPQSFTPDGFYPYYWNQPIRVLAVHNTKYIKGFDDKNSFYDPICSVAIDFVKATQHS